MSTLWIVHRDPTRRAALARAAAARDGAVLGGPGDPLFDAAPAADAIVLGLAGDLEAELQFAHRVRERLAGVHWILVAERGDAVRARALFDAIDAEILSFPPDARLLRARLRAVARGAPRAEPLPLSRRPSRDRLSQRFARWFADLDLPELLRCVDPQLADVPVLISGEPGTGKGLLARYVHAFGAGEPGPFAALVCRPELGVAELRAELEAALAAADAAPATAGCTLWMEDVDALADGVQRQLARWIEFGPPIATPLRVSRWIAGAREPDALALVPALADALSGIQIHVPPLRERPHRIAAFANDTALAWCAERGETPRRFGEDAIAVLEEYPWSANLRELEAVVGETLAAGASDPIRADELVYGGAPFAPLEAADVGSLIESAPPAPNAPAPAPGSPQVSGESEPEVFPELDDALEPALEPVLEPHWLPSPGPAPAPARSSEAPRPRPTAAVADGLGHLVGAIAHEIRNPLSTIRTFAELLPNRFDDPDFRETFSELVGRDARRLEGVVAALASLSGLTEPRPRPVQLGALIEELLDGQRETIRARHLLVLKEVATDGPAALADPEQIRFAFESLIGKTVALAPERGDVYVAIRQQSVGLRCGPSVRTLLRFGGGVAPVRAPQLGGLSEAENSLEFAIAEAIVRAQAGSFSIHVSDNGQTVVLIDLPTAS